MKRLLNLALRGTTLASKFLLVFFLAEFLEPDSVGVYGLLAAAIGYGLFVVGLEFYTYSTREIIGQNASNWSALIRDQVYFYLIVYILLTPIALALFSKGWLPSAYAIWFFILLALEHIAQELNRLLVAISEQLLASVVLFLRSGIWCLAVIVLMGLFPSLRSITVVFGAWTVGGIAACLVAFGRLRKLDRSALGRPVDWRWLKRGIRIAAPLLLASLTVRGLFAFDRFFVEQIAGLQVLGVYVLYIGMGNAILSFLDAGVIVFSLPKLIAIAKQPGKHVVFHAELKKIAVVVVIMALGFAIACWLASTILLGWLSRPIYLEYHNVLAWILVAIFIYALSFVPHMGIYAYGHDRPILYSQLAGFVVFLCGAYLGVISNAIMAIPWALCAAFLVILIWKGSAYYLLHRNIARQEIAN